MAVPAREDRRRQILAAATRVFARKGFHACRVGDIAKEAGVAYGLMYHYFSSKDELLETIFRDTWTQMVERIREVEDSNVPVREQVRQVSALVLRTWIRDPDLIRVLVREITRSPHLQDEVDGHAPGVGIPDPCVDNQFHGTRVAGTVGAQANGIGVVGVAPNVTLIPVKVCDTSGYCYASAVVDVITGTMALGSHSEKAGYSNYGSGMMDVAAPGGNGTTGDCTTTILSTLPNDLYGCIQGTSMASPRTTGVAALIVSQFGSLGSDGDVKMSPQKVENYLQSTVVDIGLPGYDECFGNGRIDAFRAVTHATSRVYDATAPYCPEYAE